MLHCLVGNQRVCPEYPPPPQQHPHLISSQLEWSLKYRNIQSNMFPAPSSVTCAALVRSFSLASPYIIQFQTISHSFSEECTINWLPIWLINSTLQSCPTKWLPQDTKILHSLAPIEKCLIFWYFSIRYSSLQHTSSYILPLLFENTIPELYIINIYYLSSAAAAAKYSFKERSHTVQSTTPHTLQLHK